MSYETIVTEIDGPSYLLRLNRPARKNAINALMMDEIVDACREAEADPAVRGVIMAGSDTYFSSGADLDEALRIRTPKESSARSRLWEHLTGTIELLDKPVLAAVEGFCMTGGWELAMACDLRIAAENASFSLTSSRIGTIPGAGGTQRLPRLIGASAALDIIFSGEPIDGPEAYRLGAINRLVSPGTTVEAAKKLITIYARRAPLSLAMAKTAVRAGVQMDMATGLEFERHLTAAIYGTADKNEGISAFLEKRSPHFTGK